MDVGISGAFVAPTPSHLRPVAAVAATSRASLPSSIVTTSPELHTRTLLNQHTTTASVAAALAIASAARPIGRHFRRSSRRARISRRASSVSPVAEQSPPTESEASEIEALAAAAADAASKPNEGGHGPMNLTDDDLGEMTFKVEEEERGTNVVGRDAGMSVDVDMAPERKEYWEDMVELLQVDIQRLIECIYPATANVAVGCVLCDAPKMKLINFQARNKRYATDILSFQDQGPDGPLLGELWVNVELVESVAKERGYDDVDEFRVLITHGLLHLAGHDHERGDEELLSSAAEEQWVLNRMGWQGSGLIERVDSKALQATAIEPDDPKTPWERLSGNVREAAYRDLANKKFLTVEDERLIGLSPDEIQQTLDEDMAAFQTQLVELEKEVAEEEIAGTIFKFRPYHHLQFSGCGNVWGGSKILADWLAARRDDDFSEVRALELSCGAVGIVGHVLANKLGADVLFTDRQPGAVEPLKSNLALNDVTDPVIETFDYVKEDPAEFAKGREFDLIVFSADAILFKEAHQDPTRSQEQADKDTGLVFMIEVLRKLLSKDGRAMVGVSEYHEIVPAFFELAKEAGFRVTRVGDEKGLPVQDARFPTEKEFGVVRLIPPRR